MPSGRSIKSSSLALLLAVAGGCSAHDTDEGVLAPGPADRAVDPEPILVLPLDPRAPQSTRADSPFQVVVRAGASGQDVIDGDVPSTVRRLVFQCSDDVTFAVRMSGDRLEVFPPGYTLGYIVLTRRQAESGLLYTRRNAEFRSNGDLATLVLGSDRYVDCVANPAAAVWEPSPRPGAPQR